MQDNNSYMMYGAPWWDNDHPREVIEIPKEHRLGNSEWVVLNRRHAQMIIEDNEVIDIAAKHIHDQESYPSILFSLKGCLDEIIYRQITYAVNKPADYPHPFSFEKEEELAIKHIKKAKDLHCLFARKFTSSFPEKTLLALQTTPLTSLHCLKDYFFENPMNEAQAIQIKKQIDASLQLEEMNPSNTSTMLALLIDHLNLKIGYEINALSGLHMRKLLEKSRIEMLYGVDSYNHPEFHLDYKAQEALYRIANTSLIPFLSRAQLIKDDPLHVATTVKENSLDFVFLNESHFTGSVSDQIAVWFPKIKKDGLIAGYRRPSPDYFIPPDVVDFFKSHHVEVGHVNRLEPGFWYVHKN